jgi:AraC family ethanolamine operon transcriptional activator
MELFYNILTYDDFDDFTASVTWDLELKQLSPGKFRADHTSFGDLDIQVGETVYNQALLQQGSVPNGFTFAVNHSVSAPITWRYLDFPTNGIIVFPENREHQGLSQPHHHPFTVTISETFLAAVAEELGLPELNQFVLKGEVLLCDPTIIDRIRTFLGSLCTTIKNTNKGSLDILINHETKWKIARLLLYALASSKRIKPAKRQFYRRKRVVDRVLEYVDADLSIPRSISELCKIAEVNERTLRNIFYEQFSLSPKQYLKCHRLNVVRSALKRIDSSKIFIADIANASGFWHMGQFAADYRRLFGELPSETMQRHGFFKLSTDGFRYPKQTC